MKFNSSSKYVLDHNVLITLLNYFFYLAVYTIFCCYNDK
jgi:hypothetical protein